MMRFHWTTVISIINKKIWMNSQNNLMMKCIRKHYIIWKLKNRGSFILELFHNRQILNLNRSFHKYIKGCGMMLKRNLRRQKICKVTSINKEKLNGSNFFNQTIIWILKIRGAKKLWAGLYNKWTIWKSIAVL